MKVTVVDEKDKIIGYKDRDDSDPVDIIRVAGLWVVNSRGEILIAQRVFTKIHDPGKWGPSAAGTVEEGETYVSNIVKEAREELGITLEEKALSIVSHRFRSTGHRYFCTYYIVRLDIPFSQITIAKDEVERVQWISIHELSEWLKKNPNDFLASFPSSFEDLKQFLGR